jgi:hypothetical protein
MLIVSSVDVVLMDLFENLLVDVRARSFLDFDIVLEAEFFDLLFSFIQGHFKS